MDCLERKGDRAERSDLAGARAISGPENVNGLNLLHGHIVSRSFCKISDDNSMTIAARETLSLTNGFNVCTIRRILHIITFNVCINVCIR